MANQLSSYLIYFSYKIFLGLHCNKPYPGAVSSASVCFCILIMCEDCLCSTPRLVSRGHSALFSDMLVMCVTIVPLPEIFIPRKHIMLAKSLQNSLRAGEMTQQLSTCCFPKALEFIAALVAGGSELLAIPVPGIWPMRAHPTTTHTPF